MTYRILFHPDVSDRDLRLINAKLRDRIFRAIEQRLANDPAYYGEPLRHHLKGYWKLRVGDYRVIYRVVDEEIWIFKIGHRKTFTSVPENAG